MSTRGPGFAVIYRWRLHEGSEQGFANAWARVSRALHGRGSLGARLHRAEDGTFYSYAQWPSAEARDRAFALGPVDPEAAETMRAAIAERFPEIVLEPLMDLLGA